MKKCFLYFILSVLLTGCGEEDLSAVTSKKSFLADGIRWNYEYRAGGGVKHLYDYAYFIKGDTMIVGKKCWKLYVENENGSGIVSYKCSLYEDEGKVSFFPKGSQDPVLLYDFGLSIGETIQCMSMPRGEVRKDPIALTVGAVDTVCAQGLNLRRLHLYSTASENQSSHCEVWVEGIGSKYDLFSSEGTRGNPFWFSSCIIQDKTIEAKEVFYLEKPEKISLLKDGRTWKYHWHNIMDISIYVQGDTIINGLSYKKLYAIDKRIKKDGTPEYNCAMREDDNKLYIVRKDEDEELVAIDYSMIYQVGNRVRLLNNKGVYEDCYEVSKLSSFSSQENNYKIAVLNDISSSFPSYYIWIEGIGYYNRGIRLIFAKGAAGGDYDYVFDSCYDGNTCIFKKSDVDTESFI